MRLPAMLYDRRHDLKYILWLPVYLVSFVVLEHLIDGSGRYWATQISLDRFIPFCEFFVIPYCLWYPLLVAVGLYLLFRNSTAFRRYMRFLAVTFFLSELIWFLIPNGQDLRPVVMPRDNPLTRLVEGLYSIDTNTNVFPSVHVVGVMAAVFAVFHTPGMKTWAWRAGAVIWGLLVTASTLLIKQHAFIDIVASLVVSALAYVLVYVIIGRRRDRKLAAAENTAPENTASENAAS